MMTRLIFRFPLPRPALRSGIRAPGHLGLFTGAIEMTRGKKATAYHEAGHAVVSRYTGREMKHVTIRPDRTTLGHVRLAKDRRLHRALRDCIDHMGAVTPGKKDAIERLVIILFAGGIAEKKQSRRKCFARSDIDHRQAMDLVESLSSCHKELEAWAHLLWVRAESCVALWWPEIKAVAAALLERETLTGDEVKEILSSMHAPERDAQLASNSLTNGRERQGNRHLDRVSRHPLGRVYHGLAGFTR
jgi:hypothetical protein